MISSMRMIPLETLGLSIQHGTRRDSSNQKSFEKNLLHQAAFGLGEKIGVWKDQSGVSMSDKELQAAICVGSAAATTQKDIFQVHEQFAAENKNFDLDKELSAEELALLKEKYDLHHLTPKDYCSLINDLCDMGVFKEEDKEVLTTSTMLTPIAWAGGSGLQVVGKTHLAAENSFAFHDVYDPADVFAWVKYRSSNEYFDPNKQSYFKTKDALLYERLGQVLERFQ